MSIPGVIEVRYDGKTIFSWGKVRYIHQTALYSIKKNRFVRAYCFDYRSELACYRLLPNSEFYVFSIDTYSDNPSVHKFSIKKLKIGTWESEKIIEFDTTIRELESIANDPNAPESLKFFVTKSLNESVFVTDIPEHVQYPPDEIERVREYLIKKLQSLAEY